MDQWGVHMDKTNKKMKKKEKRRGEETSMTFIREEKIRNAWPIIA